MSRIVSDHFHSYPSQLYTIAQQVVTAVAGQIAEQASSSMQGVGSGKIYGNHRASSPGDPPAIDTGLLFGSIKSATIMSGGIDYTATAIAYTDVEYAQHLEYGTVHMEARPFMVPAAEKVRPSFEKAMRSAVRRFGR